MQFSVREDGQQSSIAAARLLKVSRWQRRQDLIQYHAYINMTSVPHFDELDSSVLVGVSMH